MNPPLIPDSDEARDWALEELSKGVYSTAPTLWERIRDALLEILEAIMSYSGGLEGALLPIVVLAVIAALILFAMVYGNARRRQERVRAPLPVWDGDDDRSAADLREAAREAGEVGNYSLAVVEMFRAIVRTVEDQGLIEPRAGATAKEVAEQIAHLHPPQREELRAASAVFNDAMYGFVPATAAQFEALARLDQALPSPSRVGARR